MIMVNMLASRYAPQAVRLAAVFLILVTAGWLAGELIEGRLTAWETPILASITSVRSPGLTTWASRPVTAKLITTNKAAT